MKGIAAASAAMVSSLGIRGSNGSAFSLATRVKVSCNKGRSNGNYYRGARLGNPKLVKKRNIEAYRADHQAQDAA
jgi:hypothetical protein